MLKITTLLSAGLALVCAAGLAQAAPSATEQATPQVKKESRVQPVAVNGADKAQNTTKTPADASTPSATGTTGMKPAAAPQAGAQEPLTNKAPAAEATPGATVVKPEAKVPAAQPKAPVKP